jgi:hypothetical protein
MHDAMHVSTLSAASHFPLVISCSEPNSPFRPHISSSPDMSDHSASSHLKVLFDIALQDYETQTGIALAKHPLAERLQKCDSVESITAILYEQTQAFNDFRGKEKVFKLLNNAVSVLYKLSAGAKLGEVIGVVHLKALIEFHTSDPSFHRSFHLQRQYTLDSLSYSPYLLLFRFQSRIFVTSNYIRRSRASRTVMMPSSSCSSLSSSFYIASTSIRRSHPRSL